LPVPLARYDFSNFHDDLTRDDGFVAAFDVAEACLKFATWSTRESATLSPQDQYPFDTGPLLAVLASKKIPALELLGTADANLPSEFVKAVADAIRQLPDKDRPLAAWTVAKVISTAISHSFNAFEPKDSVYELEDLKGFPIPLNGTGHLLRRTHGLSTRPGPDLNRFDPSTVEGLALWRAEPALHGSFKVTVDRTCAEQFQAAVDSNGTLKIALIQLNQSLLQLRATNVSAETDPDHRFFGVGPRCVQAQRNKALKDLKLAADAGAGIALLPELVMTEDITNTIEAELGQPRHIIEHHPRSHRLRVVIPGSYHHIEANTRRNSTRVLFPYTPTLRPRTHSKSGKFVYNAPQAVIEAWRNDWMLHWPAVVRLLRDLLRTLVFPKQAKKAKILESVDFREDVEPAQRITLYAGKEFSVAVVICADLLDKTFRRVVETLQPSLVLVCNMTPKQGDFTSAAHALILSCQSTLVSVNNPAKWMKPTSVIATRVPGAMAGLPVADGGKRVIEARVPSNKILIFDLVEGKFHEYPPK
jgi:hypothetical protein